MKRSVALDKVNEYLNSNSIQEISPLEILDLVEAIGMAPPEAKEPVETHYLDARGQVVRGEDSSLLVHKWESEDNG